MGDPLPPSPRIDYLSRLPNELLYKIFEDVYVNWKEGRRGCRSPKTLSQPLSKNFLEIQRQGLYRHINIRVYSNLSKLDRFFQTILPAPKLGTFVNSFVFDIDGQDAGHVSTSRLIPQASIVHAFRCFTNLITLRLTRAATMIVPGLAPILHSSIISPRCTQISLQLAPQEQHRLMYLPRSVQTLHVTFATLRLFGSFRQTGSPHRPFSQLSSLTISQAASTSRGCEDLVALCPNLVAIYLTDIGLPGFDNFILRSIPSPSRIETLSILRQPRRVDYYSMQLKTFVNLKKITLGGNAISYSTLFFDTLRSLPLQQITFEKGELVPLPSLIAFVSSPIQQPTLRKLVLNLLERSGKIGTRVARMDLDHTFSQLDSDTEDSEEVVIATDWRLPKFPAEYSHEGLIDLRREGTENGVEVVGTLYDGIEVEEAYECDMEMLDKLWEEWKEQKSRGGEPLEQRREGCTV
ncbi:hypothetical protein JCM5353_000532 [Sporobolomyces roseus]